jgi:outer membrane protein TolC
MSRFQYYLWFWGLVFSIHAITFTNQALAQEALSTSDKYTLPKLVEIALQNTQILFSQDARIEEQRLAGTQSRVWPGASFDLSLGQKKDGDQSGPRYELGFSQPLPLSGKLGLRGGLFDLESESWRVRRTAAQATVTLNVTQLAYEYMANRRKAEFAEKRQKRFELIHAYLTGRVFPTPQRKAESRIVQNHLSGIVVDAIQSQAGFAALFEKLKVYVPSNAETYPDIEAPWFMGARTLDGKEWMAKALENNPDLRLQRFTVKGAEIEKSLANKEGLPDPSLLASYEKSETDVTETNYGLGLGLAFPSWNRNRSGTKSAEQKKIAEERLLGFEEQKTRAELARTLVEYEAARRTIQKYPQSLLSDLETQLQEAEQGFRKGQLDLLTFLELDSSASETFNSVINAQRDFAAKIAELLALTGEPDPLAQLKSF